MGADLAIVIEGLTRSFGALKAVDGVSFSVPRNSLYGILGPNGAGKTTLFSLIAGFLKPDAGSIEIFGEKDREKLLGRIGILPQDARFQPNIPIVEQLAFYLRLMGMGLGEARDEVARVMGIVGLGEILDNMPGNLSHGQYKRLALAQAFLGSPDLIILDEPTNGLDWQSAEKIRAFILDLKKDSTVLVSSHNMLEMKQLCDHVAMLERGRLGLAGAVDAIIGPEREYEYILSRELAPPELEKLAAIQGIVAVRPKGPLTYSVAFFESGDQVQTEALLNRFLSALIELQVVVKGMQETNKIEALYRGLESR